MINIRIYSSLYASPGFIDLQQRIAQSLAFHLVQKMRNIRRLAVTVWSFLNSCASDTTSSEIA
ncbi:hypothetical protein EAN91_11950 [Klebsiella pneumoniae]|nr:hypothetical protein EAN91_11950 [Klebsiella pneumoniae]RRF45795.1 hypothetical protein EAO14_14825 [Klebsiella pneumoniae]